MMTAFFGANNKLSLAVEASAKWVEEKGILGMTATEEGDEEFASPVKPVCAVASHLYSGAKVIAGHNEVRFQALNSFISLDINCLLYTSDAADE